MPEIPARKDVPIEQTWNLELIFKTEADWEKAFEKLDQIYPQLEKEFKGKLNKPEIVLSWFEKVQEANALLMRVTRYALMGAVVDATNTHHAALSSRAQALANRCNTALAFAEPELLKIGLKTFHQWVKKNPALALYTHYFNRLEESSPHVRSDEVEVVLSQVNSPFATAGSIHATLANADLPFKPARDKNGNLHPVHHSQMRKLNTSTDRTLRRNGWKNYADAHLAFKNTIAQCLDTGYKQDVARTRIRNYKDSVQAALNGSQLPEEVFYSVIDAFRANTPVWHRYWNLRRKHFGLRKLRVYDTYASLSEEKVQIPFAQAVDWICEALKPMGKDYVKVVHKIAIEERRVERAINKGKRFGAFASGGKGLAPFVFMSYDDSMFSVSTLAHELGHCMHAYLSDQNQPEVYMWYGSFAAETASNFHQAMLRHYLLKTQTDKAVRLAILEEAMSNFYRYFFTMCILAQLDMEGHRRVERGQPLTYNVLNGMVAGFLREGYGPGVIVDEQRDGCLWTQFSTHLYRNFYNYQYTTGIAGAQVLAKGILDKKPGALEDYLTFLKAGGSVYPIELLKQAGVDMSTPEPINQAFKILDGYITEIENLIS